LHDRDVFIAEIKARYEGLESKPYNTQLLAGYEMVYQHLTAERRRFYEEYVQLFGEAKLSAWQKRVVPPLPRRVTVVSTPPAEAEITHAEPQVV
jgi:hypothetical protein